MRTVLGQTLHVVGAAVLWTDAAANLILHPLFARSAAISVAFVILGILMLLAGPALPRTRLTPCRTSFFRSNLAKSATFLLAAAVLEDDLKSLPCDIHSPEASAALSTNTFKPNPASASGSRAVPKPPQLKTFGTAHYLVASLAPRCVPLPGPPVQGASSTAWVSTSTNQASLKLMLACVSSTLSIALLFFLISAVQRARRSCASPGKGGRDLGEDVRELRTLEDATAQDRASRLTVGTARLTTDDAISCLKSADLHGAVDAVKWRFANTNPSGRSHDGDSGAVRLSVPLSRYEDAGSNLSCVGESYPMTSPIPDPSVGVDRGQRGSTTRVSVRHAPLLLTPPLPVVSAASSPSLTSDPALPGYGYAQGYGGTVDFASGCIMHQPIFSQKKKKAITAPHDGFPTLLPPDFSRQSFQSLPGLSPRRKVKSVPHVTSKSDGQLQAKTRHASVRNGRGGARSSELNLTAATSRKEEGSRRGNEPERPSTPMPASVRAGADLDRTPRGANESALPPGLVSSAERTGYAPKDRRGKALKRETTKPHLRPAHWERRLDTAESARSGCSALPPTGRAPTSRPGTATSARSAKSVSSLRLVKQSLFAALDLRLGARTSVVSHDASCGAASAGSYDSQDCCSAGTFGDGVAGDSPLSTPKLNFPRLPAVHPAAHNGLPPSPQSPPPTSPTPAQVPSTSTSAT